MPNAVYAHDIESFVGDDKARGVITYFDHPTNGAAYKLLAYRLVNRPGSSTTTTYYRPMFVPVDETNGQQRAVSYHTLWRMGVRYFQVWGKTSLGVWKAEGGVQKLGDPARARS